MSSTNILNQLINYLDVPDVVRDLMIVITTPEMSLECNSVANVQLIIILL